MSILALKYVYFLGQNRPKLGFSKLNVLYRRHLMQNWVFKLDGVVETLFTNVSGSGLYMIFH